jgi:hypothetical protein
VKLLLAVGLLLAAACSDRVTVSRPAPAQPPPEAAASPTPSDTPPRCGDSTYPEPDPNRPSYDLEVTLDGSPVVTGKTEVTFTPDLPTKRLVFRLWPNGPRQAESGAHLTTGPVISAGRKLPKQLTDPTTLEVRPPGGLEAGESISVALSWRLELPGAILDRLSLDAGSYRLGSFFPVLSWVPGEGWATDPPTVQLAEANTSPIADFDVKVTAPGDFDVIATGEEVSPGHWRAEEVRDFALAAGSFEIATGKAATPEPVRINVGVQSGLDTPPEAWVEQATADIEELADRFGAYPWSTYSVAIMPALTSAGIEYPTIVFQGPDSLGRVTSHELGHMWFYSLVGSNPARDPWLDEGLTSWAEASLQDSFAEFDTYPITPEVAGRMGKPMTFWDDFDDRDYYFGVYAQGEQALDSLGSVDDVNCALKLYVSEEAYGIAKPDDLLDALATIFDNTRTTLGEFGARF